MKPKNWHWIELIGFDNTLPDFGVERFLTRLCELPEGISLLFSHIDFVNNFKEEEYALEPCDCSYAGHLYSVEHARQKWTSGQLKRLVAELHRKNIKVIFSIFNFFRYTDDNGNTRSTSFCQKHPELFCLDGKAEVYENSISILKRLADGTYYEDYLIKKIREVIEYYGFDGVQLADGLSCNRPSIPNGDFSDDTVLQFVDWLKKEKKTANYAVLTELTGDRKTEYRSRRKYILDALYYEFLLFTNDRWKTFYDKFYAVITPQKHIIFINSFWTRDPFEAFYRYGIDYKVAYREDVYALMVEEVSTTYPALSKEGRGGFYVSPDKTRYAHYEFYLMQMLLKAYLPGWKQISLLPINDTQEQWNAIHDASNELKRAIYRRNHSKVFSGGRFRACAEAPFYCLSDGIPKEDWAALAKWGSLQLPDHIDFAYGYALYYPKDHIVEDARRYIQNKEYNFHKLSAMLLSYGTDISGVITEKDVSLYTRPILALFPEYYSERECAALRQTKATVVYISAKETYGDLLFSNGQVWISSNNAALKTNGDKQKPHALFSEKAISQKSADAHGAIWTAPLRYRHWSVSFIKCLSQFLNSLTHGPKLCEERGCECKITSFQTQKDKIVILVSNDEYYTCLPKIVMHKDIVRVTSLSKYNGYKVSHDERTLTCVVPARGMEVIEVTLR